MIKAVPLTIVSDFGGTARGEDDVNIGVPKTSSIFWTELGLGGETESISARVYQMTRRVTHPGTTERRARTRRIGDGEGVLGEGVQNSTGIFEELDLLVTVVRHGRGGRSTDADVDRDDQPKQVNSEDGGSADGDRGCDDGDEGSTDGRGEHRGELG